MDEDTLGLGNKNVYVDLFPAENVVQSSHSGLRC